LAVIEKLLAQPGLPSRRLEKLQEQKLKLAELLGNVQNSPAPVLIPVTQVCRGSPEARLAAVNKMLESPDLPAHRRQNLMNRKAKIEGKIEDASCPAALPVRGRRDQMPPRQRGARLPVVRRK